MSDIAIEHVSVFSSSLRPALLLFPCVAIARKRHTLCLGRRGSVNGDLVAETRNNPTVASSARRLCSGSDAINTSGGHRRAP